MNLRSEPKLIGAFISRRLRNSCITLQHDRRRGNYRIYLKHNQVYADAADYAFIRDHILARCPQKVKVKVIGSGS